MRNIQKSSDVSDAWFERICFSEEQFMVQILDDRNNAVINILLSQGTKNKVLVELDKIIKCCFILGAKTIVISHNHPSGNLSPSVDDAFLTTFIIKKCREAKISLFDHVVVTSDGQALSLKE